jgi:hypothetical protein
MNPALTGMTAVMPGLQALLTLMRQTWARPRLDS